MHGLINRAIQAFFITTYGAERWVRVTEAADLAFSDFEAMLIYDTDDSARLLDAMAVELDRPLAEVLEDIGTFLVSNPQVESLRRLLRFGGVTYVEFLHSLDDLPDRARLAVSDLELPRLELREHTKGLFSLVCHPGLPGFGSVMVGLLRAMADDYGALVMLDRKSGGDGQDVIWISLVESTFAEGRSFDLGARAG
ncbi:heme NO-binding domain-containing protein [Sedimentitalea arenosa]|uniref:Heme NO-binding domain-containing protein n=1 Tax=Sedimentitalea arenosa TaxID=2798803 RepID=A0A8J7J5J5_9RHOB|nr:heme NO-binding domain-containing protein [Arenibacterium arenosum]MBJ6370492.1 heme NO-binding domain-containing protein [Arenibacterium arenosum]